MVLQQTLYQLLFVDTAATNSFLENVPVVSFNCNEGHTRPKQHKGCLFDHSASGLEQCILSFTMLSKRELDRHSKLLPWTNITPNVPMHKTPDSKYGIPDQQHGNFERKNTTPNYTFKQPERPYCETIQHPTYLQ